MYLLHYRFTEIVLLWYRLKFELKASDRFFYRRPYSLHANTLHIILMIQMVGIDKIWKTILYTQTQHIEQKIFEINENLK